MAESNHNLKGNCWDKEVVYADGEMNDICDEHDMPRGDCDICPQCKACEDLESQPKES